MAKTFYTSGWHLSSSGIIAVSKRPFASVEKMNAALIRNCNQRAKGVSVSRQLFDSHGKAVLDSHGKEMFTTEKTERDTVIHVGDFCEYGNDNHYDNDRLKNGLKVNPSEFISKIDANFINVCGNHDIRNKVKSVGRYIVTSMFHFKDVSIGHHPSWYKEAKGTFVTHSGRRDWTVRLCGHVHGEWKYRYDKVNRILNVNVGVDVWNYHVVSESELCGFIGSIEREINVLAGS